MKSSVCIMVAQHLSTQLRSTSAHYFWTIADDILRPPVNIWVADNVLGTINLGGHQPLSLDFTRMASGHHQQRGGGDSIDLKKGFSITAHSPGTRGSSHESHSQVPPPPPHQAEPTVTHFFMNFCPDVATAPAWAGKASEALSAFSLEVFQSHVIYTL